MIQHALLVHGYSVNTFASYGKMPSLLRDLGIESKDVYLSAYNSLDDDITCDDLANALEERVRQFELKGFQTEASGIIAHSTGAIVVRRWMLNRWSAGKPLPSHFVSLAGANHGSSLAELGATQLAHVMRFMDGGTSVGSEVLEDLDYGSEFLLKLSEEWLNAFADGARSAPRTFCFSLIGDDHGGVVNQIFWQTHENGCDTTVRVSSGNLNYHFVTIDQTAPNPAPAVKAFAQPFAHLVLHGISHTGESGILGGNEEAMKAVFPNIQAALQVLTPGDYSVLERNWRARTEEWSRGNPTQCNSTIVFSLKHPGGRRVQDSLILFQDQPAKPGDPESLIRLGESLETRQPMCNNAVRSSIAFYVNYERFSATYPHLVQIRINSGTDEITYPAAQFVVKPDDPGTVRKNEFVYVKVTLQRQSFGTYVVIPWSQNPDIEIRWPPMPGLM